MAQGQSVDARRAAGLLSDETRARVWSAVVLGAGASVKDVADLAGVPEDAAAKALRQLGAGGLVFDGPATADGPATGDRPNAPDGPDTPSRRWSARLGALADAAAGRERDPAAGEVDTGRAALLRTAFGPDGRLRDMPSIAVKQRVVLEHIAVAFEPGVRYPEREVNDKLHAFHADHAMLRRFLVEADLLERAAGVYWRSGGPVDV